MTGIPGGLEPLSPKQQFGGQTVFLTGGLGYLGSIVLEQLLRLTQVRRVYLLARGKRQHSSAERVKDLLCGPLFHLLHTQAAADGGDSVFSKVVAVEGDLNQPSLGLSAGDLGALEAEVGIILHCGASVELDADVQMTFRNNYVGTMELMRVASGMQRLRSFVHVSTYFVNNHLPRNSLVKEQIYPLQLSVGGEPVSHREYVAAMLALDAEQANRQTADLMASLDFSSTYAFGKHLTEQLVDGTVIRPGVARAIVRPSLIASLAGAPYPGFTNSYAGPGSYSMAYALGFFQGTKSVAYGGDTLLDLIPADIAASLVIVAAAAAAAAHGSASADCAAVIFHAASADSQPLTIGKAFAELGRFWRGNPPPQRLPATRYVAVHGQHRPTPTGVARGARAAKLKLKIMGHLLKLAGKLREWRALKASFKAFCVHNSLSYNKSIVSCVQNARALREQMPPVERAVWEIVWEESIMDWDLFLPTFFAGVRRLLFRMDGQVKQPPHLFKQVPANKAEALGVVAPGAHGGVSGGTQQLDAGPSSGPQRLQRRQWS